MHNEGFCPFDIWAPDHRNQITNTAFSAYAFRQQQIEDVANLLAEADDPNDFETQAAIYQAVGIDSDTFTNKEIKYIQREVARRRRF